MDFIKSILSHVLAVVFFISTLILSVFMLGRSIITYDNLYNALKDSGVIDEVIKNNSNMGLDIPDDILDYIDIDDIMYEYTTNRLLYEIGLTSEVPTIDKDELNEKVGDGIDNYIEYKIDEYTAGYSSIITGFGIDLTSEVKDYIEENSSIDFSSGEYLTDEDIDKIYAYVDDYIEDIENSSYIFDIISVILDDNYLYILVGTIIISLILIALINFNINSMFGYAITPLILNGIIYLLGYFIISNISFSGSMTSSIIESLKGTVGRYMFKYFMIFIFLGIVLIFIYFIIRQINILISHKKGVMTLDTVFDDYNSEEVVKEIEEKEQSELDEKQKKKRKKKNEKNK